MKVLYMAMAVALSCVVPAHSMSMQELQNTSRFEMLHGFGESGNGDGTYIDKDSIKPLTGRMEPSKLPSHSMYSCLLVM